MKKKIFTILSMFTMDALILHLISLSIGMLINNLNYFLLSITSRIVSVFFLVHMIMGIVKLLRIENKSISYLKYNYKTLIQRISAFLMIIFLILHIILAKPLENINSLEIGQRILVFFIEEIFFIVVLTHIYISVPKAMLSLGNIENEDSVKKQEKIELIKEGVLLAFSSISLIIYVFGGLQ